MSSAIESGIQCAATNGIMLKLFLKLSGVIDFLLFASAFILVVYIRWLCLLLVCLFHIRPLTRCLLSTRLCVSPSGALVVESTTHNSGQGGSIPGSIPGPGQKLFSSFPVVCIVIFLCQRARNEGNIRSDYRHSVCRFVLEVVGANPLVLRLW